MSTAIEWTHIPGYAPRTWNPVVGCTDAGSGCALCYARTLHNMRHKAYKSGKLQQFPQYAVPFSHVQLMPDRLDLPLKTKKPTCWFVNSVSDLFHDEVPFDFLVDVFARMALKTKDIFIILTKRPGTMAELTNSNPFRSAVSARVAVHVLRMGYADPRDRDEHLAWPLPNVWMGASASTQAEVDAAVPHVLKTNAAKRILSLEPLVETVTLKYLRYHNGCTPQNHNALTGISSDTPWGYVRNNIPDPFSRGKLDWVIVGGESGTTKQKPRPMHPDWARQVRDECKAAGVAFFFKQWGAWLPSYDAGERAHETANYGKSFGERWAANATSMRFPDGIGMVRSGKTANGHLLDGKEEFAWPTLNDAPVRKAEAV